MLAKRPRRSWSRMGRVGRARGRKEARWGGGEVEWGRIHVFRREKVRGWRGPGAG